MKPDRLDQWTKALMVLTVLAVAVFAFTQSYTHVYVLGQTHHQNGAGLRMLPLSVDWLMFAAGLAMLHLGRKGISHPLPRAALTLGATATLVANIASGVIWGWESALISAWAPVALFTAVELGMLLVRTAHVKPQVRDASGDRLTEDEVMEYAERLHAALNQRVREEDGPVAGPSRPVMPEAVSDSPPETPVGWGQLGSGPELTGIGLANGRE